MENTESAAARALLIYDGDCGFCNYWIRYWQKLTGDRVDYEPYQNAAPRYPQISIPEFERSIKYVAPDGTIASGAEATFLTLNQASGRGHWLALYRRLPPFAAVCETVYAFIAGHRSSFYRLSVWLWGRDYAPPGYGLVSWLFLRGLGLIYLAAFVSFAVQAMGLIGSRGILPLTDFLSAIHAYAGAGAYWSAPMVFWLDAGDFAIQLAGWTGAALSVLLVANLLPRLGLLALTALYLSLLYAGQEFMTYQWDAFLVETGFLAFVMAFATRPVIWLLRWLLFRFMFMSGSVKLLSHDPTWANLSALSYHFFSQPLPTPLAWYAAQVPPRVLTYCTAAMFVVELGVPFLIFAPRRLRFAAAFGILLLQFLIFLTGNYNFFNLQTMLLCLVLFDDAALAHAIPSRITRRMSRHVREVRPVGAVNALAAGFAGLVLVCSATQMAEQFGMSPPAVLVGLDQAIAPLRVVNSYGLFAVMTTSRNEIVLEGSDDELLWKEYEFKYQPGDIRQAALWNVPHQPRLDWQLWFAALTPPGQLRWFPNFLQRVLENSPPVMALFKRNPFPDRPPLYVRAKFYAYTFATPEQKAKGIWWNRRLLGFYYPAVRLPNREAPH